MNGRGSILGLPREREHLWHDRAVRQFLTESLTMRRKGGEGTKHRALKGTLPINHKNRRDYGMSRTRYFLPAVSFAFLILIPWIVPGASAAPLPGGTLDPLAIPQYVTPLVIPPVMNNDGAPDSYDIAVRQFRQQILPGGIWNTLNGRTDTLPPTTVWSYGPAADPTPAVAPDPGSQFNYPAYTIETTADTTVDVRWINGLVDEKTGRFLPHLLPVDQTLHWANPPRLCLDGTFSTDCRGFIPERYLGPVPIVTHVHGAHVEGHSDGFPEAWFLPAAINIPAGYARKGRLFDDATGTNPGNLGYADFRYRNDQPATTLWYHDHTLGMTRSNVYAGPAGFWLIRGGGFDGAAGGGILPGPAPVAGQTVVDLNVTASIRNTIREIPIVIQDRSFNSDGSLFYPETRAFFEGVEPRQLQIPFIPNRRSDISPIWNPEAFFNVMVVNGVAWPKLEVAPALYRFRFLNGCNSRFLWLKFDNPDVEVYQIGAEQGFLPAPVFMNALNLDGGDDDGKAQMLMALAERADVIVDFRGLANGTPIELLNIGPDEPFGGGIPGVDFAPADPATTGRVMKFVVNTALDGVSPTDPNGDTPATDPGALTLNAEGALGGATMFRDVSLNEAVSERICVTFQLNGNIRQVASVKPGPGFDADCAAAGGEVFGPREALLGTVDGTGAGIPLMWTDMTGTSTPVSVKLQNGSTVEVNVTENPTRGDIEEWSMYNFTEDAHPIHLHLVRFQVVNREGVDGIRNPAPWETGYKDTVIAYPGEITRVKAEFDIAGLYVWHCHIVEHEDNEMMRPFVVSAP
jgi:FtsP/CotA-like multicopper oxidase with cupredoxin domain